MKQKKLDLNVLYLGSEVIGTLLALDTVCLPFPGSPQNCSCSSIDRLNETVLDFAAVVVGFDIRYRSRQASLGSTGACMDRCRISRHGGVVHTANQKGTVAYL